MSWHDDQWAVADRREVLHTLRRDASAHPDVPVEVRVRRGLVTRTISDLSARAALVVLGSRGLGYLSGLIRGSTGRRAARDLAGPMVVVRPV